MALTISVLELIRKESPGGLTRDDIADALDVEEWKVQRALRELERAGLIRKAPELRTTPQSVYVIAKE